MSSRATGLSIASASILSVLAQYAFPAWPGFHDWRYALVLALGAIGVLRYAREVGVASAGALVCIGAGLASGLLGPDTQTLIRAPGTILPVPELGAAAFFQNADEAAIARGEGSVVLRRPQRPPLELSAAHRALLGANEVELQARPAAYVTARDPSGNRLTITQPTSEAFLSPVLLFPHSAVVGGVALPADAFATPAQHRQIKALYFSPQATRQAHAARVEGRRAVLLAADDDAGKLVPGAIAFAAEDGSARVGGVRLHLTLGTYPALLVSAVPYPLAALGGALWFALGALAFAISAYRRVPGFSPESE